MTARQIPPAPNLTQTSILRRQARFATNKENRMKDLALCLIPTLLCVGKTTHALRLSPSLLLTQTHNYCVSQPAFRTATNFKSTTYACVYISLHPALVKRQLKFQAQGDLHDAGVAGQ